MFAMTSTETSGASVTLQVKGPSGLKLSLSADLKWSVLDLKNRIEAENKDFPASRFVLLVLSSLAVSV